MSRSTHTYVVLEITDENYQEIRQKLEAAGYSHAINPDGEIDMSGIALQSEEGGA